MAVSAASVVRRAIDILQDPSSVRWTVLELVRWLDDGQREHVIARPDSMSTAAAIVLAAGTKQTIPVTAAKLVTISRNTAGDKRAITLILRDVLDRFKPKWHDMREVSEVQHYMHDPRDPRVFYVFPPALAGTSVDTIQAIYPVAIAEPTTNVYTAVVGNIGLPDQYANSLLDYILYRAFGKDGHSTLNLQRAALHYSQFASALGIELKGGIGVSPTSSSTFNKAYPARAAV